MLFQHVLFVLTLLTLAIFIDPRPDFVRRSNEFNYYFLAVVSVLLLCFYFNMYVLVPKLLSSKGWKVYLPVVILITSSILLLNYLLIGVTDLGFAKPMISPALMFLLAFMISISTSIRLSRDRVKEEQLRKERENESLKSELSLLRSQITPHFMFNVLNTLTSLARTRSDELEDVIIKISHLMRYMLYGRDRKIQIEHEVEFIQSYIEIQLLRFGDDMDLSTTIEVDDPYQVIEPMILISIIENAFKHGTQIRDTPLIKIHLTVQGGRLDFTVKNKYNANEQTAEESGIGLQNTEKRLMYLYEDSYELTADTDNDIYTVHLKLQL